MRSNDRTVKPPYETFTFNWLVASGCNATILCPQDGDVEWLAYPIAPDIGEGGFQKVELAIGMSIFRAVHRFRPAAAGRLIPLANVEINFPEPTFQVQVVRGGSILHREEHPHAEILFSPGVDLFRLTDRLHLIPVLDGSRDSEMTCLTVSVSTLNRLIGEDTTERLLAKLGLTACPKVVVRPFPLHTSAHLHGAIPTSLTGVARQLYCQARMLDYLVVLLTHTQSATPAKTSSSSAKKRAQAVHDLLLRSEGRLPTLDALAAQFGRSARLLNDEFYAEFGQSIYAFTTARRLDESHAAILNSDTPLKTIAIRLGYTHVNNFYAAFKKRFGYSPGSLRKKQNASLSE